MTIPLTLFRKRRGGKKVPLPVFPPVNSTTEGVKAGANASNISSNIENFACWMKWWMHLRGVKFYEKWKKKKKIVLDDVG